MRGLGALALIAALGLCALGQVQYGPSATPAQVLELLEALAASPAMKWQTRGGLAAAMEDGRLTPQVAYALFLKLQGLSPGDQEAALQVLIEPLQGGYPLDRLFNEALKGLRLSRPWPEVEGVIRLRVGLLKATGQVLERYGLLPQPGMRTDNGERLVLEVAWAVGDHLVAGGSPADTGGMSSLVKTRLARLRERVLPAWLVDPLLQAISPALLSELVGLALDQERR